MKFSQFSIRTTLLAIIGTLNILIAVLVGSGVYRSWGNLQEMRNLSRQAMIINLLYISEKHLSLERGLSMVVADSSRSLQNDLAAARKNVDKSLDLALKSLKPAAGTDIGPLVDRIGAAQKILQDTRIQLDASASSASTENKPLVTDLVFDTITGLTTDIASLIQALTQPLLGAHATVAQQMLFKYFVWEITEYAGREYARIAKLIADNETPSPELQKKLILWNDRTELAWSLSAQFAQNGELGQKMASHIEEARTHYFLTFDQIKDMFYMTSENRIKPPYPISIDIWLDMATQALDSLLKLKDMALQETQIYIDNLEREAKESIAVNFLLLACALALSFYSWRVIAQRVLKPVNTMIDSLYFQAYGPLPPKLSSQDEIGKLSVVLNAFKENTHRIEKVSEERLHYMKSLEDSNRELDDFSYIASHDLKEPLRGLHNFSHFLLEDYQDKLDDEGKNMLHTIADLTRRMDALLSSLLHYSRLGRTELSVRAVDLDETARNAIAMHAVKIKECQADVKILHKLPVVVCDHVRIAEVFQNIIGNALKYNDKSYKKVEIGYLTDHPACPGQPVYFIRDNGIGIERKNLDVIFKIFRRLHAQDAYGGGTGSGLTIVRKIITRHGGKIWAESQGKGKGTTFFFTIPPQIQGNMEKAT